MSYPDTTAAAFSWVDQPSGIYPNGSVADFTWVQGLRSPRIDAKSTADAVSRVTAVSVGSAMSSSLADGQTSDRTPSIEGSSFVIGTENAVGVTKGSASGMASSSAAGYGVLIVSGFANGSAQATGYGLIWLTSIGKAEGYSLADGRGIFNKDFAGRSSSSASATAYSRASAVSVGTCHGFATVGASRPISGNRNPAAPISGSGLATGRANGRASVGKKPRWRLARVVIPMTGNPPAIGTAQAKSRVSGVSDHG